MTGTKLSLEQRIRTKTARVGDCIVWTGMRASGGRSLPYGLINLAGRVRRVHRVVYELTHGPLPAGSVVMHTCDNPGCINVIHLAVGCQTENIADMHSKGRARYLFGTANHKTKLTPAQVLAIRERYVRYSRDHGTGALAREFGVSKPSIRAVLLRQSHRATP